MPDNALEVKVHKLLKVKSFTLVTAESCTGGLVGDLLTNVPGSSDQYLGGVVSYSNQLKMALLGVPETLLVRYGAVSEPVALAMARGARERLGADISVAVTGIAGPGGGSEEKPVGLTFIGFSAPWGDSARKFIWGGDRLENKRSSAQAALTFLIEEIQSAS